MQLTLDGTYRDSTAFQELSGPAQCALEGLLELAHRNHCDWVVEGTPQQIADWVTPGSNLTSEQVVEGLRELDRAGCIKRSSCGATRLTSFVVRAPVVER